MRSLPTAVAIAVAFLAALPTVASEQQEGNYGAPLLATQERVTP